MLTQVFVAATAFGLATVAAALEDGAFGEADRRVLVASNTALVPETSGRLLDSAGIAGLTAHFDRVVDLNETIHPQHPALWNPREDDLPLMERYLRLCWQVGGDVHLVVESVSARPASVLCRIFCDARIDVYADGLMSYGPTRNQLSDQVVCRIERVMHIDIVPGLRPLLLTECAVTSSSISVDAFRKVIATLDPAPSVITSAPPRSVAVLLGQYLAALGILTLDEEAALHLDMVRGAVAAGFRHLVFKPHPTSPVAMAARLVAEAAGLDARLDVVPGNQPVECWFRHDGVGLVVGCFSTAIATASVCYDLPVARAGTEVLLKRLRPFENSNRIPATIVHAGVADLADYAVGATPAHRALPVEELTPLVRSVGYCMQPRRLATMRSEAEEFLRAHGRTYRQYFTRRRLTELDLPGRTVPARHPVKRAVRRLLGPPVYNGLGRLVRRLKAPQLR